MSTYKTQEKYKYVRIHEHIYIPFMDNITKQFID